MAVPSVYSQTTCLQCGNPIPQPNVGRPRKYCNAACSNRYWYAQNRTPFIDPTKRKGPLGPQQLPLKLKFLPPVRYGPANNKWKGGVSLETQKWRASDEYKAWRIAVYRRDHFTCQRCGAKAHGRGTIVAHHIKSWHEYPSLRFDVDNGTTLCRPCHAVVDDWIRNNWTTWREANPGPTVKGEKHGNAKMTEAQARDVIRLLATNTSQADIARQFGISAQSVCDIKGFRTWKHLPRVAAPAPSSEAGQ